MKKLLFYTVVALVNLVVCSFLFSCGNGDLTKSDAKKRIEEELNKDSVTRSIWLEYYFVFKKEPAKNMPEFPEPVKKTGRYMYAEEKLLQDKGLLKGLSLVYKEKWRDIYYTVYKIDVSERLKPLIVKEYKQKNPILNGFKEWHKMKKAELLLGETKLISIESITKPSDLMGQKVCTVKFNYNCKPNVAGKCIIPQDALDKVYQGEALFVQYTDGWKIEKGEPN